MSRKIPIFDSHCHIIDPRFPLVANQGYLPDAFSHEAYLSRLSAYELKGGAVVSGSFQAFDQGYLRAALQALGDNFVGVTQLPHDTADEEILDLHHAGVRALRFNLYRGGTENLTLLTKMAARVFELAGWHIELYVDSGDLKQLSPTLLGLPAVSIDHLGLRRSGFTDLLRLAEKGVRVKATGFGRVDFDVAEALQSLYQANPDCLMFGSDLPSTRAPIPFQDSDIDRIIDVLGSDAASKVLSQNACQFYKIDP